ncbi:hypothetical protein Lal_00043726 [Lupinus albus]|nr:hypothetical protein Lal_00043726 [Lupinus albus]
MKKDMYSPKRNPNEFTRTPTFETTLQAIKDELRTIQGQMEELRLEFERKPPKREVKIKVPSFIGKNDPEAYLKWKIMMEKVFNCNFYNEEEKVLMATSEFKEKALSWWVQIQKVRSKYGLHPINTWERLKSAMRFRYAPKAYQQTNHNKMRQIIEDLIRALKDESRSRKRELEIMSETLVVSREDLSETLVSQENTLSETLVSEENTLSKGNTLSETTLSVSTLSENTMSKIQSEGVGQIFPQEMISVLPHTNQRVELEDMVDHVHWTKTKIRIVENLFLA